jgi:hypothetical protein
MTSSTTPTASTRTTPRDYCRRPLLCIFRSRHTFQLLNQPRALLWRDFLTILSETNGFSVSDKVTCFCRGRRTNIITILTNAQRGINTLYDVWLQRRHRQGYNVPPSMVMDLRRQHQRSYLHNPGTVPTHQVRK